MTINSIIYVQIKTDNINVYLQPQERRRKKRTIRLGRIISDRQDREEKNTNDKKKKNKNKGILSTRL